MAAIWRSQWKWLTDIKAQSPQYSIKSGRVASKNAGEASRAVANPALIAYFDFRWTSVLPNVQSTFLNFPVLESWFHDGVWIVSGAWGWIFGKLDWNLRFMGMIWALRKLVSAMYIRFALRLVTAYTGFFANLYVARSSAAALLSGILTVAVRLTAGGNRNSTGARLVCIHVQCTRPTKSVPGRILQVWIWSYGRKEFVCEISRLT